MIAALLLGCLLPTANLIDSASALVFGGDDSPNGLCTVAVVPAPDTAGLYTLKLTFRVTSRATDWIDAVWRPSPPLSLPAKVPLVIRAEQPADYFMVKITDPDNPGANHSAFEQPLRYRGQPLPAKQWLECELDLPADPARRDTIDSVGFYVACPTESVPLNTDLVFYVGRFEFQLPARAPWPPRAEANAAATTVPLGRLAADGVWEVNVGASNPTGKPATLSGDACSFSAAQDGWNEFLHSRPAKLVLAPATTYRLTYDYEVTGELSGGDAPYFYQLVRVGGGPALDVGWQKWSDLPGATGRRVVTFTTQPQPDSYLIWGIRNAGGITIRNLQLEQLGEVTR